MLHGIENESQIPHFGDSEPGPFQLFWYSEKLTKLCVWGWAQSTAAVG